MSPHCLAMIVIIYFKRKDKHFQQYIRENCTKFLVQMSKLLGLCFVLFGMSGSIGEGSGEQLLQNLANERLMVLDGYRNGREKQRLKTQLLIGKNSVYKLIHIRNSTQRTVGPQNYSNSRLEFNQRLALQY